MPTHNTDPTWKKFMGGSIETSYEGLAQEDIDLTTTDATGRTALHWAAIRGNVQMIVLLRFLDMEVSTTDAKGKTAIDLAKDLGHSYAVNMLQNDDYINAKISYTGDTMLHFAYITGNEELATNLIAAGINIEAHDGYSKKAAEYIALLDSTSENVSMEEDYSDAESVAYDAAAASYIAPQQVVQALLPPLTLT